MSLHFPIAPPYVGAVFPRTEYYDISDPEPADWRLKILVESSVHFWVYAVCAGKLSAVPPWELVENGTAPLRAPDQTFPGTISLYLEPNRAFAPQIGSPFGINHALEQAGLGRTVRCYVYENIDPSLLSAPIQRQLEVNQPLNKHNITSQTDRWEMFAEGEVAIWINGGDALAQASTQHASVAGRFMAEFGVMTTTGFVNPVYFFQTMQPYLHDPTELGAFKNLIGPNVPFLAPQPATTFLPASSGAAAVTMAQQRLYPAPALYEVKRRLSLTATQWRAIGDGQKSLYWDRLLRSSGHATTGSPFLFHTDDLANPFQLEAVAEFFTAWEEPGATGTAPAANVPQPAAVDLQQDDWNIVIIDPFQHASLGSPEIPRPDYYLAQHSAPSNSRCDSANPLPSPFNADTYDAVLFLIHHGEIKAWYRWSTYSSHKWEARAHQKCHLASSLVGNKAYHFRSLTASKKVPFINYAFMLSSILDEWSVPGKYYFRNGTPEDDGTITYDPAENKTGVIIHRGQSANTSNQARSYNGSGGCVVSPSFSLLRSIMVELHWEDQLQKPAGSRDQELLFLRNRTSAQSQSIFTDGKYPASNWNEKLRGMCYVIRPDEPTQK